MGYKAAAVLLLVVGLVWVDPAGAQAAATATAGLRISAFGGVSGNYTGLQLAKNLDVTAGADVGFRPFFGIYPSLEARGMYAIDKGQTVAMKNALGGIKLARHDARLTPYGDFLYGRGKLDFPKGYPDPTNSFLVVSNTTSVLSFGGGLDFGLADHLALKGDFQLQRYNSPVTASGQVYSKVFTVGVVYRLGNSGLRGLRGRHF